MNKNTVIIDGSSGEGGGQILRTSLTLSLITGRPIQVRNIRGGRKKPGILRQHLTSIQAAAAISHAEMKGASLGSALLDFAPGPVKAGAYSFAVGSAGSATLVLQTILPALMVGTESSALTLEGGTHNPWAPPFTFLDRAFLPLLRKMGPKVAATLHRHGFYPAGGGRFDVAVVPVDTLRLLHVPERGDVKRMDAEAYFAHLPAEIAKRELSTLCRLLDLPQDAASPKQIADSDGPGNMLKVEVESEHVTEVFTEFGQKGVRAQEVAHRLHRQVSAYLASEAPVGEHLADQLLLPLALAGGGSFRTTKPSLHLTTNIEVIRMFLDLQIAVKEETSDRWMVEVTS